MKIEQLIYFRKIAQLNSMAKAAKECNITQPTLSVAISDLEEELGIRLFQRMSTGTKLTDQGRLLLEKAQHVLDELDDFKQLASQIHSSLEGIITVLATPTLCNTFVPDLMVLLKSRFPFITPEINVRNSRKILEMLSHGEAQFGLLSTPETMKPTSELMVEPLFVSRLVACATVELAHSLPSSASLETLSQYPIIVPKNSRFHLSEKVKVGIGEKAQIISATDNIDLTLSFCQKNLGIAFLPYALVSRLPGILDGTLRAIRIEDEDIEYKYSLVYKKNSLLQTSHTKFIEIVHAVAKEYSVI